MPSGKQLPFSRVELEVRQVIAGRPPAPLILEVLGGGIGGRELAVSGAPRFEPGQEAILFIQGNGRQIFPLSRMAHGHYPISREAASGREFVKRSDGEPLHSVSEVSRPIHAAEGKAGPLAVSAEGAAQALTPEQFVQAIRAAVTSPHLRDE